jgi:phosphopantothenoylcysteine decarboxylase/phosphopantothenoylcysteine decarboxylase/phosphopantothenate--cysteine ligase
MARILLGITGSIAAYRAADLAHRFVRDGHEVDVVFTRHATEFITPLTLRSLTGRPVYTDDYFSADDIRHVSLAREADVALIAPATANIIGKLANGIADDYLSTIFTALVTPARFIAPAMNTNMYDNPIVVANLAKLIAYGWTQIEPQVGLLACGDVGKGALASVDSITNAVYAEL